MGVLDFIWKAVRIKPSHGVEATQATLERDIRIVGRAGRYFKSEFLSSGFRSKDTVFGLKRLDRKS